MCPNLGDASQPGMDVFYQPQTHPTSLGYVPSTWDVSTRPRMCHINLGYVRSPWSLFYQSGLRPTNLGWMHPTQDMHLAVALLLHGTNSSTEGLRSALGFKICPKREVGGKNFLLQAYLCSARSDAGQVEREQGRSVPGLASSRQQLLAAFIPFIAGSAQVSSPRAC